MNFQNNAITQALVVSLCITYGIDAAWGRAAARFLTPAMAIGAARYSVGMDSAFAQGSNNAAPSPTSAPASPITAASSPSANSKKAESPQDEIERYFAAINKMLNSIPPEHALHVLVREQQYKMLKDLTGIQPAAAIETQATPVPAQPTEASTTKSAAEETDLFVSDELVKITKPKELSPAEAAQSIKQRVENQFIGDLPEQVKEIINYFEARQKYGKVAMYPNKLLLYGMPGLGKTHLTEVMAHAMQYTLLTFSAGSFMDKYMGEGASKMRKAFLRASAIAKAEGKPVIVFIDELDTIAAQRKDGTHQEYRAILTTLLTNLEDYKNDSELFFVTATNDLPVLDAAVKNRFAGLKCKLNMLDWTGRRNFFKKQIEAIGATATNADLDALANATGKWQYVPSKGRDLNTRELAIAWEKIKSSRHQACLKANPSLKDQSECTLLFSAYAAAAYKAAVAADDDEKPKE